MSLTLLGESVVQESRSILGSLVSDLTDALNEACPPGTVYIQVDQQYYHDSTCMHALQTPMVAETVSSFPIFETAGRPCWTCCPERAQFEEDINPAYMPVAVLKAFSTGAFSLEEVASQIVDLALRPMYFAKLPDDATLLFKPFIEKALEVIFNAAHFAYSHRQGAYTEESLYLCDAYTVQTTLGTSAADTFKSVEKFYRSIKARAEYLYVVSGPAPGEYLRAESGGLLVNATLLPDMDAAQCKNLLDTVLAFQDDDMPLNAAIKTALALQN